jgi:hypothetical protein
MEFAHALEHGSGFDDYLINPNRDRAKEDQSDCKGREAKSMSVDDDPVRP